MTKINISVLLHGENKLDLVMQHKNKNARKKMGGNIYLQIVIYMCVR